MVGNFKRYFAKEHVQIAINKEIYFTSTISTEYRYKQHREIVLLQKIFTKYKIKQKSLLIILSIKKAVKHLETSDTYFNDIVSLKSSLVIFY